MPARQITKVKSKKEVFLDPFCYIDGHQSSQECGIRTKVPEVQRTSRDKGWVVLRGDVVKDGKGSCAAFTEQGSSASQMTAARGMDIIARPPGGAGPAAHAVSSYTQVTMEEAPKLLEIPKSECPDIWIRLPRHKWPKPWSSTEDPVVPLERNLYGHPLAGLLWERQFEKILLKHGDVIAILPGCARQAADAVSALHQSDDGGRCKIAQHFTVRMSRYVGTSSTTPVAQILVKHRRLGGSS